MPGTLTLADLRIEVKDHLSNPDDLTDAQVDRALNIAQERMARAHSDFEELQNVTSGVLPFSGVPKTDKFIPEATLSPALKILEIYSFRLVTKDGRSRKLVRKSARMFDRAIPEPEFTAANVPLIYTKWKTSFELYPVQDVAYDFEFRFSAWPLSLTSTGQFSDLDGKDDLILNLAISWIFNSRGSYEQSKRFFGIFAALWRDAMKEDRAKPDLDLSREGSTMPSGQYWLDPFVKGVPGS